MTNPTEILVFGQYVVGLVVGLGVTAYVFYRNPRSMSHISFLLFGLLTSGWNLVAYLHRTAPDPSTSRFFVSLAFPLVYSFPSVLLLTIIWLVRNKLKYSLILAPGLALAFITILSGEVDVVASDYGWSYITSRPYFFAAAAYQIAFAAIITIGLLIIRRRSPNEVLRRKLGLFWVAYVAIYVVGVGLSNSIMQFDPNFPPVGGMMTTLMFTIIAYGVSLKPAREHHYFRDNPYQSLVSAVEERTSGQELGEKDLAIEDFLRQTGIISFLDQYAYDKGSDHTVIAERILSYLTEKKRLKAYSNEFLAILNFTIESTGGELNRIHLERICLRYLRELLDTDIFYGAGGGSFLRLISEDSSLDNLPDWEAAWRFMKRLLLVALWHLSRSNEQAIWLTLHLHGLLEQHQTNEYYPVLASLEKELKGLGEDDRLPWIEEKVVPIFGDLLAHMSHSSQDSFSKVISIERLAINLNRACATRTGILNAVVSEVELKTSRTTARRLSYADKFDEDQLDQFSRSLSITHLDLEGKLILYECASSQSYDMTVRDFMMECLANGKLCEVYTSRQSVVHRLATKLKAHSAILSPSVSTASRVAEGETLVPVHDVTSLLDRIRKSVKTMPATCIVFDSLTDLVLNTSYRQAYAFVRYLVDVLPETKAVMLVLVYSMAHEQKEIEPLRALAHIPIVHGTHGGKLSIVNLGKTANRP